MSSELEDTKKLVLSGGTLRQSASETAQETAHQLGYIAGLRWILEQEGDDKKE